MLSSQLCSLGSLRSPAFLDWSARLRPMWDPDHKHVVDVLTHRKMWEWLFIASALDERKMLQPGRRGIGFGVGREPLVAAFAATGATILATDLPGDDARAAGWTEEDEQYAGGIHGLNDHALCDPEQFTSRVVFRPVDMRAFPDDIGTFDFCWSSCAFEHLGSLAAGTEFVERAMDLVAPGGVAVHTTEYNVSSRRKTVDHQGTVLYRKRDIRQLARRLRHQGYRIHLDLAEGRAPEDRHVDVPPYSDTHLRMAVAEFVTTSLGLIVEKPRST